MKKLYLFIALWISIAGFSQEDAWVYFNVKNNSQFYYDNPLEMLSQRALDRRTKQNIPLDLKDIPIDPSFINQIKSISGITVMAQSKWLNALHIRGSQADINSLKLLSFVERVDFANQALNGTGKKASTVKMKSVAKLLETQTSFGYGSSENQIKMLNGDVLHQQNYTGSGKIIAVLDAGFPGVDTAQPFQRLQLNHQILGGYDYVNRNSNFYTGDSHGTKVLSAMGGYKDGYLVGTAPDASYYLFRTEYAPTENPVEESYWVEAAEEADRLGVDVINTSLGYFEYDNTSYNHTYSQMDGKTAFMTRGAEIAFSRGMIVVASAGNEGNTSNPHVAVPGDGFSVLTVGAVNSLRTVASFSSIGPSFDGRVKPDVMAQGVASVLSEPTGSIVTNNGTSFSGPIIAGMVACLWQAYPDKTNKEIKDLIIKSSDHFLVPTTQYGYGIPNFSLALSGDLGVTDFSTTDIISYPNPTADLFTLALSETTDKGTIRVFDVLGKLVLEKIIDRNSLTISLKSFDSGIYIYELDVNGLIKTGKIIKQ